MKYEVEMKFRVAEMVTVEARLAGLGTDISEPQHESDVYFAHPARDFAQTDEALRIRRKGQANFITYKGPKIDPATKTRREIDLLLPPGEETAATLTELLLALGFQVVGEVRKSRRKAYVDWHGRSIEVSLDDVERLGTFAELELVVAEGELDDAKACIASLAERLELEGGERRSYLELLLERRNQQRAKTALPFLIERQKDTPGRTKVVGGRTYCLSHDLRWERVRRDDDPRPSVSVSGTEFGRDATVQEVRYAARNFWRERLKGRRFKNEETGLQIGMSRQGIDEILSHSGDIRRAWLIAVVPDLIREAVFVHDRPHLKPSKPKYDHWIYFHVEATMAEELMEMILQVGIANQKDHWLYTLDSIQEVGKPAPKKGSELSSGLPHNSGPSIGIIDANES